MLLILNLILYLIVISISGWAVNHAIEKTHESASVLVIPARIFPIYFPFGNMATGVFIIFSLIAGVVGFVTSFTGIKSVTQWTEPELHSSAASALTTWLLTLLSMGLACKEINLGWTESTLRTLEVITIILGGTQLLYTGTLYAGIEDLITRKDTVRGRV